MTGQRRILVTGASGFVGSAVAQELHAAGFLVTGLSRADRRSTDMIAWMRGDLSNADALGSVLDECWAVVNVAGMTGLPRSADELARYFAVNCDAAAALAIAARRAGVARFIQVSSTGVFGRGTGSYDENTACNPDNAYEQSKLVGERAVLAEACADMRVIAIRPSNVFGERHPWNKLLSWMRAVQKGLVVLAGDPCESWVNYVYVRDVSRVVANLLAPDAVASSSQPASIFIVNTPSSVRELLDATADALGVAPRSICVPRSVLGTLARGLDRLAKIRGRPFPLTVEKVEELGNRQIFVADKLRGMQPDFPCMGLREGLRRTGDYYRREGLL